MDEQSFNSEISPWWRRAVILTVLVCFGIQVWIAFLAYQGAPPIPDRVVNQDGEILFTGKDIQAGQAVFLKYGLMENGTIWGHGAYLGPDFSAEYLHTLGTDTGFILGQSHFGRALEDLPLGEQGVVKFWVRELLKENRYDPKTRTLVFRPAEELSFLKQVNQWTDYFVNPALNGGLKARHIKDPVELRNLTAFFAWTAWASVARRPGRSYSYTNNFPYDPLVGNTPIAEVYLWSALSLITLLAGTAAILFAFGKFSYLGWRETPQTNPVLVPGTATASQQATVKYFVIVTVLFLVQTLIGAAVGHNRAEPGSFFGFDLYQVFPSNILRTWHLQLALFWIVTAYIGGGLMLAAALGEGERSGSPFWGLNVGLALMVLGNLFPGGVLQLIDVMQNGYWHARGLDYVTQDFVRFIEWCRMPGDLIFIFLGVVPMVWAALLTYREMLKAPRS